MNTRFVGAALATAATLLLAGCGNTGTSSQPSERPSTQQSAPAAAAEFNRADVEFVCGMIPHHQQAIDMAEMVPSHTDNAALRDLAARISQAQEAEIETMRGWLRDWNVDCGDVKGGMTGMMGAEDMAALKKAHASTFDEMWLRMMIEHHRGALDMARMELKKGRNDAAQALARRIIEAQKAEIAEMKAMLEN